MGNAQFNFKNIKAEDTRVSEICENETTDATAVSKKSEEEQHNDDEHVSKMVKDNHGKSYCDKDIEEKNSGEEESSSEESSSEEGDEEEHDDTLKIHYYTHNIPETHQFKSHYNKDAPFTCVVPQVCSIYDQREVLLYADKESTIRPYNKHESICWYCKRYIHKCDCSYSTMCGGNIVFITACYMELSVQEFDHPMTATLVSRNILLRDGSIIQSYTRQTKKTVVCRVRLNDQSRKTYYVWRCSTTDKTSGIVIRRISLQKTSTENEYVVHVHDEDANSVFPRNEYTFMPGARPANTSPSTDGIRYRTYTNEFNEYRNNIETVRNISIGMHHILYAAGYGKHKNAPGYSVVAPSTVKIISNKNHETHGNKNKRNLRGCEKMATVLEPTIQNGQIPSFTQQIFAPVAIHTLQMARVCILSVLHVIRNIHECSVKLDMKMDGWVVSINKIQAVRRPWGVYHVCDPFMTKTNAFKTEQLQYRESLHAPYSSDLKFVCTCSKKRNRRGRRSPCQSRRECYINARRDGIKDMRGSLFGEDANLHGISKWRLIFSHIAEYYAGGPIWLRTKHKIPRKCNVMMDAAWPFVSNLIFFDIVDTGCVFCNDTWPAVWPGLNEETHFLRKAGKCTFSTAHAGCPKICIPCILCRVISDTCLIRGANRRTLNYS